MILSSLTRIAILGMVTLTTSGAIAIVAHSEMTHSHRFDQVHQKGEPMKAQGKVVEFHKNDRGDIDGIVLDGSEHLHFPPHNGERILKVVNIGDEITAEGVRRIAPNGEEMIAILQVSVADEIIMIDQPKPKPPKHTERDQPSNADLMRELKELRKLVESLRK